MSLRASDDAYMVHVSKLDAEAFCNTEWILGLPEFGTEQALDEACSYERVRHNINIGSNLVALGRIVCEPLGRSKCQ